jgi:hypothetical protein
LRRELERSFARSKSLEDYARNAAAREKEQEAKHAALQVKLAAQEEEVREARRRMKESVDTASKEAHSVMERQRSELDSLVHVWKREAEQERERRKALEEALAAEKDSHDGTQKLLSRAQTDVGRLEAQCRELEDDAALALAAAAGNTPCAHGACICYNLPCFDAIMYYCLVAMVPEEMRCNKCVAICCTYV